MSTGQQPPKPSTDPYANPPEEPVRGPERMRGAELEHVSTGRKWFRLAWETRGGKLLSGLAALSVLAALVLGGLQFYERLRDDRLALPIPQGRPIPPRPVDSDGNSVSPWVATPADAYPVGREAIILPAVRAAGPFTAKQVAAGLSTVREALVAGRIDATMVVVNNPEPFLALLAPENRTVVRGELAEGTALNYVTRVDGKADPALNNVEPVRAQGSLAYRAATDADGIRVLEITTSFIWVYRFDLVRPQEHPPGAELVTVRDRVVWHIPHPADVSTSSRGLWVHKPAGAVHNADCEAIKRGFLALSPEGPLHRQPGAVPTGDIFDPNWRPGDGASC